MTDLISRQAAILELRIWWDDPEDNRSTSQVMDSLPTIDPVKHGEWNETGDRGGRNYACGCCRFTFIVDTCMGEPMWNYCPNCGAKMDGGEG